MINQRGYIALSIVILTMAVVMGVATTVTLLSIGEAQSSFAVEKGEDTWTFVEGCAEDALLKIQSSSSYAGGTFTRPEGTCSVTVNTGNPNWDITVTTTAALYKRTVNIQATRTNKVTVTKWVEI